jgi:signal transduction histidine kinase
METVGSRLAATRPLVTRPPRVRADRALAGIALLLALAFLVCSTAYSEWRTDRVRLQAHSLAATMTGAVADAQRFRSDLHELEEGAASCGQTRRMVYGLNMLTATLAVALATRALRAYGREQRGMEERIDELEVFASRVAHDIRSPLTSAVLALQRVGARLPQGDSLSGLVDRGSRSLQSIERIVEALLAFATAGAAPTPGATAPLGDTIEAVVAEHADAAAAAGVELTVECAEAIDVACAPGLLSSVAGNLVANAVKYMGDTGERRILVRGTRRGRRALLEVIDTGPGLPPGAERLVFEPYVRLSDGGGGIGLGLATVKRIVVAHGGTCGVRPAPGHGCVFWAELPLAARSG